MSVDIPSRLRSLSESVTRALPRLERPFAAHLRVELAPVVAGANGEGARVRDLLLGVGTVLRPDFTLLDWRTAPLAESLFACEEGETFELELNGRELSGRVLERNLVDFCDGRLARVWSDAWRWFRDDQAEWRRERYEPPTLDFGPLQRRSSPLLADLDPSQRHGVELPPGVPLLALGEAGTGKTTVALHRVARLRAEARAAGRPFRAAVVVPTEGLRRLSQRLLEQLAVDDVPVHHYDDWALAEARRVFPDLPLRTGRDATAAVLNLKRHAALTTALETLAPRLAPRRERPCVGREALLHLFGDRMLLTEVVARTAETAPQTRLPSAAVDEVLAHTRVQFSRTTEEAFADVTDAQRLQALDGRPIDEGTPTQDAATVDPEDAAALFELERLVALRAGRTPADPAPLDCLVVDEAQELAPLELNLLGRSLAPDGSLIVAGDEGQQVDPHACFRGWTSSMVALGAPAHERLELVTSYRCPPPVTALARAVLTPNHSGAETTREAPGVVERLRYADELHLFAELGQALRRLVTARPAATAAVICRSRGAAHRGATLLGRALDVRLALDGDFSLRPGVDVTTVEEVKGLEFDVVVVPDANPTAYPNEPGARRALYVAVTRATERLTLASVGAWSPVLP